MKNILSFALLSFALCAAAPVLAQTKDAAPASKTATPATKGTPIPGTPAAALADAAAKTAADAAAKADADAAAAAPPGLSDDEISEMLKGIVMHKHPDDFASTQQLAIQNREDRIAVLKEVNACLQKATTVEDIYACQTDERKSFDKVALSYCDTTVSLLPVKRVVAKKKNKKQPVADADGTVEAKPKATDCDRALSVLTGRPIPPKPDQPQVDVSAP